MHCCCIQSHVQNLVDVRVKLLHAHLSLQLSCGGVVTTQRRTLRQRHPKIAIPAPRKKVHYLNISPHSVTRHPLHRLGGGLNAFGLEQ